MKTNMTTAFASVLAALALGTGCQSTPPAAPPTVNQILDSKNVTLSFPSAGADGGAGRNVDAGGEAAQFVRVASPFKVYPLEGGGKRAQMRIRNVTEETFGISYGVSWFDKGGMEILSRPRKTVLARAMSTLALTDTCPEPTGVSAEIELQLIPADKVEAAKLTFENAAKELVAEFSSDAQFLASLKKVQASLDPGQKPVMVVRSLDDNSGGRQDYFIQTLAKDFRNQVRKTGLLDVKDDAVYQALTDRINFSANGGLERNTMLAAYGTHVPPDFILTGELRKGEEKGTCILFLTLHDLSGTSGRGGTIAWEDKAPISE